MLSIRLLKGVLFFLYLTSCAWTKSTAVEQRSLAATNGCSLYNSNTTIELIEQRIRDSTCNIKSLEDVLKILPSEMLSPAAMVFHSRSLQGPHAQDFNNPRIILGSIKESGHGLFATFNGNNKDKGYQSLEFAQIDLTQQDPNKMFRLVEINFPINDEIKRKYTWNEINQNILVEVDPKKCSICHGFPGRPIFGSYPLWNGTYGSGAAGVVTDTTHIESKKLEEFKAYAKSHSRYSLLNLENVGKYGLSLSENLNITLGQVNGKIIAKKILQWPDFESVKNAYYAAFLDCQNFESFLPSTVYTSLKKNIEFHFKISQQWPDKEVRRFISKISQKRDFFMLDHTLSTSSRELVSSYNMEPKEIERRLTKNIPLFLGSDPFFARLAVDTLNSQTETSRMFLMPTKLRLLTEGRNIPMDTWALDLTQPTYRFHNGITGLLSELLSHDKSSIASKVRDFIKDELFDYAVRKDNSGICAHLRIESLNSLRRYEVEVSKQRLYEMEKNSTYPHTFLKTCSKCHSSDFNFGLAPEIPFDNPVEMKKWLSKTENKTLLINRIWHRNEEQRMPPNVLLRPEQKVEIQTFLRNF